MDCGDHGEVREGRDKMTQGMTIEIVTSMSLPYRERVGKDMIRTFFQFVEKGIRLRLYHEASAEGSRTEEYAAPDPRISMVDLHAETDIAKFLTEAVPRVSAVLGYVPSRDPKERLRHPKGYDYAKDALTFGRKAFSFIHAARTSPADLLFWIDADIVFTKPLPAAFLSSLLDGFSICYLPRVKPHAETGFFGVDRRDAAARAFVAEYAAFWECLRVFKLSGWTDSHAFDAAVTASARHGLKARSLSKAKVGPVLASSVLAEFMTHRKGPLKLAGSAK